MMIKFLRKLYEQRLKDITVILLDDSKPGEDNSFEIRPNRLFTLFILSCVVLSIFFVGLFMITPLGSLLYTKEDAEMRADIENITDRVLSLQDSLIVRDQQLAEMKNIIRLSLDTTLTTDQRFREVFNSGGSYMAFPEYADAQVNTASRVTPSGIVFTNTLNGMNDFPSNYPVKGTFTREYDPDTFHFGIDIATAENVPIKSIADGTVVNASWTINDGYVLTIQHASGIISVYKHCSSIAKKSGDVVLKGDIVGTTGNVGTSSTGPHLHLEIWKDGIPQDPALYLIQ
jgi:murein DD-endopeptidase MepM/ murein hydrolase activator NlpD